MGRPPLDLIRTHVSISAEALARIDAIVGEKGRSAFVRRAVDHLLHALDPAYKAPTTRPDQDE